jgi:hypothetical protein
MGLVKPVAPAVAPRRSATALVIADDGCCSAAIAALKAAVDLDSASVSVITVRERERLVESYAPLTGLVGHDELRRQALDRANEAARRTAADLRTACVEHRVALTWRCIIETVDRGGHDVVVLAHAPRRGRLRELVKHCERAGTALVLAQR